MDDEFEKILRFFDLKDSEKQEHLKEIYTDAFEFFNRFKHIMQNGTRDEKKEAVKKLNYLKSRIEKETEQVAEKTGLTKEQLSEYANNPGNFDPEMWNFIQKEREKLETNSKKLDSKKVKTPKKRSKKKWIQS
mgnify:CR=1 FL=1